MCAAVSGSPGSQLNIVACPVGREQILFLIPKPEVFKSTNSNTFVVIGEMQYEDLTQRAHASAAKTFEQPGMAGEPVATATAAAGGGGRGVAAPSVPATAGTGAPAPAPAVAAAAGPGDNDASQPLDETGLDPDAIAAIMKEVNVSRARAVAALRQNNGDVVNAIVSLS